MNMTVWVVMQRNQHTGEAHLFAVFSTEERAREVTDQLPWRAQVIKCQVDPT